MILLTRTPTHRQRDGQRGPLCPLTMGICASLEDRLTSGSVSAQRWWVLKNRGHVEGQRDQDVIYQFNVYTSSGEMFWLGSGQKGHMEIQPVSCGKFSQKPKSQMELLTINVRPEGIRKKLKHDSEQLCCSVAEDLKLNSYFQLYSLHHPPLPPPMETGDVVFSRTFSAISA